MSTQSGFPQTQAQPQHETLLDPIRPALSVGAATGKLPSFSRLESQLHSELHQVVLNFLCYSLFLLFYPTI